MIQKFVIAKAYQNQWKYDSGYSGTNVTGNNIEDRFAMGDIVGAHKYNSESEATAMLSNLGAGVFKIEPVFVK